MDSLNGSEDLEWNDSGFQSARTVRKQGGWRCSCALLERIKELLLSTGDEEEEDDDSTVISTSTIVNMEALFQTYMAKQSLKFLLGYMGVQLVYLICFFVAAALHKLNYVPLVADCVMLLLHLIVVLAHFYYMRYHRRTVEHLSSPRLMLDLALIIDSVLFALSDPVVESQVNNNLHVAQMFDVLGGIPILDGPVLHHPYKSNSVFQFHIMYMTLFVLSFKSAFIMTPLCMVLYSYIVLSCYRNYYHDSEPLQQVVWEDVFTDIIVMLLTLFCMVLAKRMLEQLQRSCFQALQCEKKKALAEKVLRCKVEFENASLQDLLAADKECNKGHRRFCKSPEPLKCKASVQTPSVKSAPAAMASRRRGPGSMKTNQEEETDTRDSKSCDDAGDCLPSNAVVWVENHMDPQPLYSIIPGQRVLCFDTLLQCVKHVEVAQATVRDADVPKEYVTVELADGTLLEMTSDHHVECFGNENYQWGKCIPAADLKAGEDNIMVLNMMPQQVCSVVRTLPEENSTTKRWVSLNVQQPQRNLVFVANEGQKPRYPRTMAVGSADLKPSLACVKCTFLELRDSDNASSRKTNSAPPACCFKVDSPTCSPQLSTIGSMKGGQEPSRAPSDLGSSALDEFYSRIAETSIANSSDMVSEEQTEISSQASFSLSSQAQPSASWRRRQRQRERRRFGKAKDDVP